jgi:alpha-glucosidase
LEHRRAKEWSRHNTTLPFTRLLAGHADYTPVVFGERRLETSWPHQIATAAIYTSPLLVYGGHPRSLLDNPAVEIIKRIPSVWDETIALPICEIGEVAGFARRKGDTWFVAILNGPTQRTVQVPLTFLAAGTFQSLAARDQMDRADAVRIEQFSADRDSGLSVDLRSGGGYIAVLSQVPSVNAAQ